jgi:dienelactone hydrolase
MKYIFLTLILFNYYDYCFSQSQYSPQEKPPISLNELGQCPSVSSPEISPNGNYALYTINNQPKGGSTLIVLSTISSWKKEFILKDRWAFGARFFSDDNKQAIFLNGDTLFFISLGTNQISTVTNISSFKYPKGKGRDWLAYQQKGPSKDLVLFNLLSGRKQHFFSVNEYSFDDNGNVLLIMKDSSHALQWVNLSKGTSQVIWSSATSIASNCNFDTNGKQLVFSEKKNEGGKIVNSIWYYNERLKGALLRVNNRSSGIESGLLVNGSAQFSKNGRWIFFDLEQPSDEIRQNPDAVMVDIWNYKDLVIQPEQMRKKNILKIFSAVVSVNGENIKRIEQSGEQLFTPPGQITGDFVVIQDNDSNREYWWNLSPQPSFYLISLKTGERKLLRKENKAASNFSFSPLGTYLVFYDALQEAYLSCSTETGKIVNITKTIPTKISTEYVRSIPPDAVAAVAGWNRKDESLLIYDNFDIWEVDPKGVKPPINITNGYGLKHLIKFRLVYGPTGIQDQTSLLYDKKTDLLLTAFETRNKYNGFYRKATIERGNPELLTMGPYTFFRVESQKPHYSAFNNGIAPLKAAESNVWILQRQSATVAPNYFFTKDFKTYKPLSDLQPQGNFNWLTSELITWKMLDGRLSQGVLYKPENFDPRKKYPIIFNYYEKLSHRVYEFPQATFTESDINIPWFVSNGYLVFTPDIYYEISSKSGKTYEEWAYNSVVSAAEYLSTMPFVNAKKMAIQGHSFGGGQTNYIVTHSSLFAAACESAGITDRVSSYLTLAPFMSAIEHSSAQDETEHSHSLTGATLWERPDLYLKSSAVLNADKVTTPLLIIHNQRDNQIPWRQGVEFYMALRRLGKKSWMLQYDNGDHGVIGNDAKDYTIRLTQFFDHYLKDKPAPVWMTKGVPFSKKGIDTGYELDTTGAIP